MTIATEKANLRIEMKARRAALTSDERAFAAQEICARLASLEISGCVAVYLSKGDEASMDDFISALLRREILVAAPVYEFDAPPRFAQPRRLNDVRAGAFGLRVPRQAALEIAPQDLDVIYLPGLAFDKSGARLGYGGGWYDKVRPSLRPNCLLVGVCYDFQLRDEIPCVAHDARVSIIVTPSQIFHV